jgi:hypothetical protein
MKNKDNKLIWESYEDVSVARMQGDEHNPPAYDFADESSDRKRQVTDAMNHAQDLERIASKYQDMTDAQLEAHAGVIDALIEAGEEYRARYFEGEAGAPF